MAWTNPKTWVTNDPLIASDYNTQFRDNLNALRAQTQDMQPKVNALYPGVYQASKLFKAVIGINSTVTLTNPQSLTAWHANCKLTFTPQTDEVLFAVQFIAYSIHGERFILGLKKGSTDISLQQTAMISGNAGQTSDIVFRGLPARENTLITYQTPLPVTRDTEITISPTIRFHDNEPTKSVQLVNPSLMILTALEAGVYG